MKQTVFFPRVAWFTALGWVAVVAGCGTSGGPRDLMMEEASAGPIERPVAMRGESTFLEGKLTSVATVSRGFDRGSGRARSGDGTRRQRRGEENGAFNTIFSSYGESEADQKEAMEDYVRQAKARRAAGSPMPPVTLRVQFENKGTEPVELEVTEVNSTLGNFAVRPPKLIIAPGEQGMLEPMISQLGVTSDEIPLKLAVRIGNKRESQVVIVKNIISESLRKEFENLRK